MLHAVGGLGARGTGLPIPKLLHSGLTIASGPTFRVGDPIKVCKMPEIDRNRSIWDRRRSRRRLIGRPGTKERRGRDRARQRPERSVLTQGWLIGATTARA